MTKKDYEAIAAAMRAARYAIRTKEPAESQADLFDGVRYAEDYLADVCARDNPRFDRSRFLRACGIES